MNKFSIFLLTCILSFYSFGFDLKKYTQGSGAQFAMDLQGTKTEITMSVAYSTKNKMALEIYMNAQNDFLPLEVWQQFHLSPNGRKLMVTDGYVLNKLIGEQPQRLTAEYLKGYEGGLKMETFLISSKKDLNKHFIKEETIQVPAGKVKAKKYKVHQNGQTIYYWLSDQAKPFGLVKLISTSKKKDQNYNLELTKLVRNVRRRIEPNQAIPLNKVGRSFLPKVKRGSFLRP